MRARARFFLTIAFALLSVSSASRAFGSEPDDRDARPLDSSRFAFTQDIEIDGDVGGRTGANGVDYRYIALGGEHYRACRDDLGDIRIFDSLGAQCPYILDSRETGVTREIKSRVARETARGAGGEGDAAYTWREYQIVDYEEPLEVNALRFGVTEGDFSARIEAYGRDAKSDWSRVATDTIYRLSGVESLSVELDSILYYPFWRIESRGTKPPFGDATLEAVLDRERQEVREYRKETALAFGVSRKGGKTIVTTENPDRLAVTSISIEAPAPFRRFVAVASGKRTVARDEVYRIGTGGEEARRTKIVRDRTVRSEKVELTIEDGDDAPLAIAGITAEYAVDRVVFRPTGNPPYRLAFGNVDVAPPSYDMSRYRDDIPLSLVPQAALLVVSETPGFRPEAADTDAGKTVFSVVVVATSLALSAFVVVLLFKRKDGR